MPHRDARPDVERVADRLHSAAIHLLRGIRREDQASGLSAARLSALSVVVYAGPLTLGELAAAEQVRPPTITRLAQALEAEGLVRRTASEHDARATVIAATPRGRRALERARRRRLDLLAGRLRELPHEDLRVLERAAELMEGASRGG